MSDPIPEMVTP